jgi:hypothetical protein
MITVISGRRDDTLKKVESAWYSTCGGLLVLSKTAALRASVSDSIRHYAHLITNVANYVGNKFELIKSAADIANKRLRS